MLFDALKVRQNFNEYDPLDFNSIVQTIVTNTTTYTVPAGKTLLIKGVGSPGTTLLLNGVTLIFTSASTRITDKFRAYNSSGGILTYNTAAASSADVYLDTNFILPIKSGGVLSASTTATWGIYGWLIDE